MIVIRIRDLADSTVLAGALAGATLLRKLVAALPPTEKEPQPLFLDFEDIEVVTASYLREAVLALKSFARSTGSHWYPVVANASHATLEELEVVCTARSDTILTCRLSKWRQATDIRLAGSLDAKQREAFEFVVATGGATAKDLMAARSVEGDSPLSPTAWNNRLSVLAEKGIVAESYHGRQKLYTPVLKEAPHGH